MSGPLSADAEIVDGADQTFAEIVLPDPIDHDPRQQRPRPVLDVGDPVGQGVSLQRTLTRWSVTAGGGPILLGRLRAGQDAEKAKLDERSFRIEVAPIQQPGRLRLGRLVRNCQRSRRRLRLRTFYRVNFVLERIPLAALVIIENSAKVVIRE